MTRLYPLIATALLCVAGRSAAATLSTMTMPSAGHDLVTWNTWKGQSFSTLATMAPAAVTSVTLRLEIIVPNASLVVRVVGSGGTPGIPDMSDVRAELRPVAPPTGTAVAPVTFAGDPAVTFPPLEAGATYWLVAGMTAEDFSRDSPAGLVRWHFTAVQGQDPGGEPGWAVGSAIASSGTAGTDWLPMVETPFQFSLTAVPVPEPAGCGLLLSSAFLVLRRRRS